MANVLAESKPGWQTTEFWLSATGHGLIAILAYMQLHLSDAGVPPLVTAISLPLFAATLGWLNKTYGDNRTAIKTASLNAAADPLNALNK